MDGSDACKGDLLLERSLDTLCGGPAESSLPETVGPGVTSPSPDTLVGLRLRLHVELLPVSQLAPWSLLPGLSLRSLADLCGELLLLIANVPLLLHSLLREEFLVVVGLLISLFEDGLLVDLPLPLLVLLGERLLEDDFLLWNGAFGGGLLVLLLPSGSLWEMLPVCVLFFLSTLFGRGLPVDLPLLLSPLLREEFLVGVGLLCSCFEDGLLVDDPLLWYGALGEHLPVDDPLLWYRSSGEGLLVLRVLFLFSGSLSEVLGVFVLVSLSALFGNELLEDVPLSAGLLGEGPGREGKGGIGLCVPRTSVSWLLCLRVPSFVPFTFLFSLSEKSVL